MIQCLQLRLKIGILARHYYDRMKTLLECLLCNGILACEQSNKDLPQPAKVGADSQRRLQPNATSSRALVLALQSPFAE
jgi:hypothetical protein